MENYKKLIDRLRSMRVEIGSFVCLGCGYEHNCGIHGCAVLRESADAIATLSEQLTASEIVRKDLGRRAAALAADNARLQGAYNAMTHDLESRTKQVRELQKKQEDGD